VSSPLPELLLARRRRNRRDWAIGLAAAAGAALLFVLALLWGGPALALGTASLAAIATLTVVAVTEVRACGRW
jgi:hypothetical protein